MDTLTKQDIDILMKALSAYKSEATQDSVMMSMLRLGLSGNTPEEKAQTHKEIEAEMEEAKIESMRREETVILLKAKLIHMRDQLDVHEAASFLLNPK